MSAQEGTCGGSAIAHKQGVIVSAVTAAAAAAIAAAAAPTPPVPYPLMPPPSPPRVDIGRRSNLAKSKEQYLWFIYFGLKKILYIYLERYK